MVVAVAVAVPMVVVVVIIVVIVVVIVTCPSVCLSVCGHDHVCACLHSLFCLQVLARQPTGIWQKPLLSFSNPDSKPHCQHRLLTNDPECL